MDAHAGCILCDHDCTADLLLTLRYLVGDKANGFLLKINRKIEPYTHEALAVIATIAGIYLISDASDVVFFNGE